MAELQYIAQTELRHDGEVYNLGDDVTHFAPLMPSIFSAVSVGHIQLVHEGEPLPIRYEVRTNPVVTGLLIADIEAAAQATPAPADGPDTSGEEPPEGSSEPAEEDTFDPADYTVDAVVEWAAENPDEIPALIVAEAQGKNRVTLIKRLNELTAD